MLKVKNVMEVGKFVKDYADEDKLIKVLASAEDEMDVIKATFDAITCTCIEMGIKDHLESQVRQGVKEAYLELSYTEYGFLLGLGANIELE